MPDPGADAEIRATPETEQTPQTEATPQEAMPASPAPAPRIPSDALSDRNAIARAKGLPGVLIQGGTDPDPEATRQAERPYVRLLLVMIAIIVLGGFVLGFVGMVIGGPTPS